MLKGLKYLLISVVVVTLFLVTRSDLLAIRGLSTDTTFYTTQLAELTRLEKELLTFRVSAAEVYRGRSADTSARDRMLLAFDILWSRTNTEYGRFATPPVDALRQNKNLLGSLANDLRALDQTVQNLKAGDSEGWNRIEEVLLRSAPQISAMTNQSYDELYSRATHTTEVQRTALQSLNSILQIFVSVILIGVLMLLWQLRKSERLTNTLQEREAEILKLATVDALTGLKNRRHFDERMKAIDSGEWIGNLHMIMIDLDGFKDINDTFGHAAGDHLLKSLSGRLPPAVGHDLLFARLGGDEFAVVFDGPRNEAMALARKIIAEVSNPVTHGHDTFTVGASIGVSTLKRVATPASTMLREADLALYEAKASGKGRAVHFLDIRHKGTSAAVITANMMQTLPLSV